MSEFTPEVEPAQVEGAEVEAPAETWAGPAQEEWEAAQETLNLINQAIQQPYQQEQQQYQQQPTGVEFDPLADNAGEQIRAMIREEMAPLASYQEQLVLGEAEERAKDIIHSLESEKGEFLNPQSTELALQRANMYLPETQQRFGYGPRAAEAALQRAYEDIKAHEDAIGKAYYDRQVNQIRGLSNAPQVPGSSGQQAGQQVTIPQGGDEFSVVANHFQAR